jgi:hypothetical protein
MPAGARGDGTRAPQARRRDDEAIDDLESLHGRNAADVRFGEWAPEAERREARRGHGVAAPFQQSHRPDHSLRGGGGLGR